jgi:signal transduction histidine kinase
MQQEGMLAGMVGETEKLEDAPPRRRLRLRLPSRHNPTVRLFAGLIPPAAMVAAVANIDHFVAPVLSLTAPLLLAVVMGSFLGGTRAGVVGGLIGEGYLAVHYSSLIWPPQYNSEQIAHMITFAPCALAAALLVGLLQRRNAERVVREREHGERMATLERVKSQFLNVASHELRGPLGVVNGYMSMVGDGSFGTIDSVDMRRVAPVVAQKVAEMNTLVNEMLDTARLEESRLSLSLSTFDLGALVERAVEAVTPLASEKHEVLYTTPRPAITVTGDEVRTAIVVTNLLHNAVKYSPSGGVVQIFVALDGDNALVSVWDHGLGISADDMPRLFSRFGRVVTRENSNIPGTGLGLYLARELARLHGGDIMVRSSPGKGSVFTLVLPVAGPPARADEE